MMWQHGFMIKTVKVLVAQSFRFSATPWTIAEKAFLSINFCRQEYREWIAIPFTRDSNSGIELWISSIAGEFLSGIIQKFTPK